MELGTETASTFLAERILRQYPKEDRNDECGKWQSCRRDLNAAKLLTKKQNYIKHEQRTKTVE